MVWTSATWTIRPSMSKPLDSQNDGSLVAMVNASPERITPVTFSTSAASLVRSGSAAQRGRGRGPRLGVSSPRSSTFCFSSRRNLVGISDWLIAM